MAVEGSCLLSWNFSLDNYIEDRQQGGLGDISVCGFIFVYVAKPFFFPDREEEVGVCYLLGNAFSCFHPQKV